MGTVVVARADNPEDTGTDTSNPRCSNQPMDIVGARVDNVVDTNSNSHHPMVAAARAVAHISHQITGVNQASSSPPMEEVLGREGK